MDCSRGRLCRSASVSLRLSPSHCSLNISISIPTRVLFVGVVRGSIIAGKFGGSEHPPSRNLSTRSFPSPSLVCVCVCPSVSASASAASAMSSDRRIVINSPAKEGWLEKQSRHLKRWKRRWFVLQDSTLYSFKKEKVYDDPTEIIDLRIFSSVKSSEDYTNRTHSFDVYSSDMVFSMVAASESEKEDWIRAIGRAIVISRTKSWQEDNDDDDIGRK